VLFVHGFAPEGITGFSCAGYWGAFERSFAQWGGLGPAVGIGYLNGDRECEATIGSADRDVPIEAIGRRLAWFVYRTYSAHDRPVDLVGHSMGGLVIRAALAGVEDGADGWPPDLLVPRVVTIASPHDGTPSALSCTDGQCREMRPGSAFLTGLAENPQVGGGTTWTLIGSLADGLVSGASAVGMAAAHRSIYLAPRYDHITILADTSEHADARWREVDADGGETVHGDEPHSVRAVYEALRVT
jgi:triacylglycerol esterase/lipase EstA (alpha/beta hydrolase family)